MRSGAILIDHTRWMAGSEIDEVYAVGMGRHVGGGDGEDNGLAGIRFKNGVFASLLGSSAHPGVTDSWWRLGGTKGVIEHSEQSGLSLGKDGWTDVPFEGQDMEPPDWFRTSMSRQLSATGYVGWKAEFEEFVASIRERQEAGGDRLRRPRLHRGGHRHSHVPRDRQARPAAALAPLPAVRPGVSVQTRCSPFTPRSADASSARIEGRTVSRNVNSYGQTRLTRRGRS